MESNGNFTTVWVMETNMTAFLADHHETCPLKRFEERFGFDNRQFGHTNLGKSNLNTGENTVQARLRNRLTFGF